MTIGKIPRSPHCSRSWPTMSYRSGGQLGWLFVVGLGQRGHCPRRYPKRSSRDCPTLILSIEATQSSSLVEQVAGEPADEADRGRHRGFARHECFAGGPGSLSLSFGGGGVTR